MEKSMDNLTTLGAGVLGAQIAWHSAFMGKNVVIYDPYEDSIESCKAILPKYAEIYKEFFSVGDKEIDETNARISFTTSLSKAVEDADIVIESVPEIPEIKNDFYRRLAKVLPERTLIATNTSTLLPSDFAEHTGRPEKFAALHFANMIWSMNMAEVMAHAKTAESTILALTQFAIEIGMVPIPIQKETNAYVMNTMTVAILNAAQTLVTNGVSTPEYIDRTYMILNRGVGYGPCGLMDIVGMTTLHNVFSYWGKKNNDLQMSLNAEYLKTHFVDTNLLGQKSGEGYYTYPTPAYSATDFLAIPDISQAKEIAKLAVFQG